MKRLTIEMPRGSGLRQKVPLQATHYFAEQATAFP
jgi:hypothetical protein